jgi:hypothetical protein
MDDFFIDITILIFPCTYTKLQFNLNFYKIENPGEFDRNWESYLNEEVVQQKSLFIDLPEQQTREFEISFQETNLTSPKF